MGTGVSSQYSGSKSVTSTSGETKAIASTNDGRWRWWRQALGAGPGAQLSPPGLGSARLRTAEEGGQTTRGGREGEAAADRSAAPPLRRPRAETQQGPTRAPAQPGRLRGGGRGASLGGGGGGGRRWRGASLEGGGNGRRASLTRGRRRPGSKPGTSKAATEPEGKKAAAESEPEASKAAAPSGASLRKTRPARRRRGLLASCSAGARPPGLAGRQTRPALLKAAGQSPPARPGGRWQQQEGGDWDAAPRERPRLLM